METGVKQQRKPPRKTNFFNWIFFTWTIPVFRKGARRDLLITDLDSPPVDDESERLTDALEREWNVELENAKVDLSVDKNGEKQPKSTAYKPSLLRALIRVFWMQYMFNGLFLFVEEVILRVLQPWFQKSVISYFTETNPEERMTRYEVYMQALALVGVTFSIVLVSHHVTLSTQQIGMRIRTACCSLIYRKVLRLDLATVSNTASGQVVNLLSNDVARFDTVVLFLHFLWIMPIQMFVIGYVMWQFVGICAVIGIAAVVIQTIPIQGYLSLVGARLRAKIAVKTDSRVQLMSELIAGIQVVKMYAWEKPFELLVSGIRMAEMKLIARASYVRAFYWSAMNFSERVNLYCTLTSFVLMGNLLTPESSFVLTTFFNTIQITVAFGFPQALITAGESNVSLKRIEEFLMLEEVKLLDDSKPEKQNEVQLIQNIKQEQERPTKVGIEMEKVTANWVRSQPAPTLSNISMVVSGESLCGLVGPVGSGKSSLLHVLLGELPVSSGSLTFFSGDRGNDAITGRDLRVSYSSQDPWIFTGTVRDNILFGQPYDKERYAEVTKVCALLKDFEQLPDGDLSSVGERGTSLSGGQKARVNLARAVYKDADVYLLDDPLSAVDARVGRHLFEECIQGYLRGKTRVLVTHQLQYLRQVDTIIVLERGLIKSQGTFEELSKSLAFLKTQEHVDTAHEVDGADNEVDHSCEMDIVRRRLSSRKVSVIRTNFLADEDDVDVVARRENNAEVIESGLLSRKVYAAYFAAGGNACSLTFLVFCYLAGQVATSGVDYWLSFWTNQQMKKARIVLNNEPNGMIGNFSRGSLFYDEYGLFKSDAAVAIYTTIVVACVGIVVLRSMLFVRNSMNASRNIHNTMFSNLLSAKMRFFNTNPSGRILNRFSKDIGAMDEMLPKAMVEGLQIFLLMLGIVVLVIISNYLMAVPAFIIGVLFYFVAIYYLKTAQHVKRLEGVAKSPVFSQVDSTIYGLTTIRSRGLHTVNLLRREFDRNQDTHTTAWDTSLSAASAFGFLLDIFSCIFIGCVCVLFISTDDGTTSGSTVGLAVSQSLILIGMLQYGVRQSADVVSQMTAVERVLQYTKLPQEGPFTTAKPPAATWPAKGCLSFKQVHMKYVDQDPPVLKDLNVEVKPGWKVGIVGRTGAGKSSLIAALFRLVDDGLSGKITIDSVDTKSIGLHELRPKISIIPQEPVLFSASLRYNLDPFGQYSDAELWACLREVELGDAVPNLEYQVAGGGANFSIGQRQLICLARAILRNNRLLVLDEATANIDPHTDALIQKTIRQRFSNCTVLTIAHRLNTIMDSDRALIMERGCLVEFGHPHVLLQNPDGYFSRMVQQAGKSVGDNLASIAERAYKSSDEDENESAIIDEMNSTNL